MRALLACLVLVLATPASADPLELVPDVQTLLSPPQNVTAAYNATTGLVTLAWTHDATMFHVYQDGVRVATTPATSIVLPPGLLPFYITAEQNGTESAPSRSPWPWPLSEYLPDCGLVRTGFDPDVFPHVFVIPDQACIEAYEDMVTGAVPWP